MSRSGAEADLAAIFATVERPRRSRRGLESAEHAAARAAVDRVIAGLLFMAGLRRSEVAALEWRDVADAEGDGGLLVAVRGGKTNPDGETADVRYVKGDVARAVGTLRERRGDIAPTDRVVGLSAQAVSERFAAAARAAGVEPRLTAHSGRVGLASELTARGASAHDTTFSRKRRRPTEPTALAASTSTAHRTGLRCRCASGRGDAGHATTPCP